MIAQRVAMICDSSSSAAAAAGGAAANGGGGGGGRGGGARGGAAAGEREMDAKVNALKQLQAQAKDIFLSPRSPQTR
jgi:hypothetical protein